MLIWVEIIGHGMKDNIFDQSSQLKEIRLNVVELETLKLVELK